MHTEFSYGICKDTVYHISEAIEGLVQVLVIKCMGLGYTLYSNAEARRISSLRIKHSAIFDLQAKVCTLNFHMVYASIQFITSERQ
jgi:hypothetical protein